jgi:two-component system CheB/CheR fusion protein
VLREACAALAAWRRTGAAGRMSVNVSAQHLAAGHLGDDVARALEAERPAADDLVLEITEQALVVQPREAGCRPGELRERGCQSRWTTSAPATARWPTSATARRRLKIDRTFVTGAATGSNDGRPALRRSPPGREPRLGPVVEGIETEGELQAGADRRRQPRPGLPVGPAGARAGAVRGLTLSQA